MDFFKAAPTQFKVGTFPGPATPLQDWDYRLQSKVFYDRSHLLGCQALKQQRQRQRSHHLWCKALKPHIDKDKEVISWDVNHSNHGSPGLTARSLGKSVLTVIGGIKLFVLISKTNTMTKKIDKKTNAYTSTNTNASTNATTKRSSFGTPSTEANI